MAAKRRYFYTFDTPYEWSSGPRMIHTDTLEEAKEAAEAKRGYKVEEYTGKTVFFRTTYGIEYVE